MRVRASLGYRMAEKLNSSETISFEELLMANMANEQYLEQVRKHLRESIAFFSNPNKSERERCVVRAFFRCLGVSFEEKDLSIDQPEPVDIAALGGRFQITEVLALDRLRHKEYKEWLEKLKEMSSDDELLEPWKSSQPIPWSDVVGRVMKRLLEKTACADIDALVYVNLDKTFLDTRSTIPNLSNIINLGWRSVSLVYVPYSFVMFAADSAPDFIRRVVGSPRNEWKEPDGWFEPEG